MAPKPGLGFKISAAAKAFVEHYYDKFDNDIKNLSDLFVTLFYITKMYSIK